MLHVPISQCVRSSAVRGRVDEVRCLRWRPSNETQLEPMFCQQAVGRLASRVSERRGHVWVHEVHVQFWRLVERSLGLAS